MNSTQRLHALGQSLWLDNNLARHPSEGWDPFLLSKYTNRMTSFAVVKPFQLSLE
ncbi:MAG TPA: hypothetical protein VIE67_00390 [Rudaea sp.]|jgi:hypothetical protein|uniref:hypothetical protein n=1 Tax=Rudaea sp. TaxID=2136325 RepID=UPI002F9223E5